MKIGELLPIQSIYSTLSDEQRQAVEDYCRDIKTYTPYIKSVKNHWFKDLDFEGCYEEGYYPEGEGVFTYEYVGLGEEDDVLAEIEGLYVCETREKDYFQISEPQKEDKSNIIKNMLTSKNYNIYNGVALREGQERPYKAIIEKINGTNVMDTSAFQYAFAILESVHTQDAEYILRDLKELFRDMGINVDEEIEKNEKIEPLEWIIPDYIPVVWDPMFNTQETSMTIRARGGTNTGFMGEEKVVIPANGTIESITTDEDNGGTQTIKITFTGTDRSELLGLSLYIRGLNVDSNISVGDTISKGTQIGTTIASKNITVIMTNKNHSAITNVDSYICPPERDN